MVISGGDNKFMSNFCKKGLIGIDIGFSSIKLVELKFCRKKIKIINSIYENISHLNFIEKSPEERKNIYIEILSKLKKEKKIKTVKAAVSVGGNDISVKYAKITNKGKFDYAREIEGIAGSLLPFDIQDAYVDYQILDMAGKENSEELDVIIVGCKKQNIDDKIEILLESGFYPVSVDLNAFALSNIALLTKNISLNKSVALLDIGFSLTTLCIFQNGNPVLVRQINVGGYDIDKAIKENIKDSEESKDEFKIKYGISGVDLKEKKELEEQEKAKNIATVIESVINKINTEITRSIYYLNTRQDSDDIVIEKLLLSGGSANLKGLADFIAEELGFPVEIFRPLSNAEVDSNVAEVNKKSPALAIVAGLAANKSKIKLQNMMRINLIAKIIKKEKIIQMKRYIFAYSSLILVIISSYFILGHVLAERAAKIKLIKQTKVEKYQKEVKKVVEKESKYSFIKYLEVEGVLSDSDSSYAILKSANRTYIIKEGQLINDNDNPVRGVRAVIRSTSIMLRTKDGKKYILKIPD